MHGHSFVLVFVLLLRIRENTTPSFILMDVQGAHVTVYVYQEIGVEVKVEKLEYQKPGS